MTPFGARVRELRRRHGLTLKTMAADLNVSAAYLSALEHGKRGRPGPGLVMQICGYFNLIWDEAEALKALAEVSQPRVVLDTSGLAPQTTAFANRLAEALRELDSDDIAELDALLVRLRPNPARRGRRKRG